MLRTLTSPPRSLNEWALHQETIQALCTRNKIAESSRRELSQEQRKHQRRANSMQRHNAKENPGNTQTGPLFRDSSSVPGPKRRLLVIDDDEAMRGMIRHRLQRQYEIVDTGDATEALALALEHRPDCILLDLTMPFFSGLEFCQAFCSLSHTRMIPIFVITGQSA